MKVMAGAGCATGPATKVLEMLAANPLAYVYGRETKADAHIAKVLTMERLDA